MAMDTPYNYRVVKQFTWAAIIFGVIGMLVGVIIAAQLRWPTLFGGIDFLSYGRLRPVHTSGVIFAFGGNALFATSYYIVQRVCSVRLVSDKIAAFTFYGYQAVLVLGVLSYVLGYSQSKEYAELPWLLDILLAVVWVAYAYVFFFTIGKRKEKHIYVGLWFYGAYIIAVAVLHIFNNLALPIDWLHSYPVYSGAVDAMAQWWYGHNAVGFFLTAAFLGMMYYFVPKQAGRPIYSYRLSIVHFWALISIYMWAGPHHLHYTALPDWTQSLGMAFSVILWVPSWGGMINGMMTLSGAWNKLVTDPIIRFLFVALSFYGMSTFEGPMMAIKEVNALSHYTEWTVGHVHSRARLGGDDYHGLALPHAAAPLRQNRNVLHPPHLRALLAGDHRYRAVCHLHVGCRHHGRPLVARNRRRWQPHLQLHRNPRQKIHLLLRPLPRWCLLPERHVPDGI